MNEARSGENPPDKSRQTASAPSPALPSVFQFVESPADFRESAAIIVRVPRGVRSKQKLFSIYVSTLRFPQYFGWNWDAFEECLRDLSWLPANRSVVIVHEDLPFGECGENRGVYLAVLRSAVTHTNRIARVIWPAAFEATLNLAASEPR
jgi:hypothetical protein